MHPPHLPPPTCNIKTHARLQHVPTFLVVLVIALLAGCSAALATIAWIAPPSPSAQFFGSREAARPSAETMVDPTVANQAKQRMIVLYDVTKKINGTLYPAEARIGSAALLTSDGWAVTSVSSYRVGEEKNWEGIDHQGIVHRIVRVSLDAIGRPLYIQFAGSGFRIVLFAPADGLAYGAPVWVVDGEVWRRVIIDRSSRVSADKTYPIWRPEYAYRLRGDWSLDPAKAGRPVFTDRGAFVGVVDEDHLLIPGWVIEVQIPSILAKGVASYPSLGLEGHFIQAIVDPQVVRPTTGFLLTKVSGKNVQHLVKGDVVLRIGSDLIDPESVSRRILSSSGALGFTMLRNGREKEVDVRW